MLWTCCGLRESNGSITTECGALHYMSLRYIPEPSVEIYRFVSFELGAINVAPSTTRWYVCGQSTGTGERLPADEMRLPYPTATIRGAISIPMVDIVGDPGIGKSRSLHEFVRRHSADPIMMLRGNCSGHGQETPFAAEVRAKLALAIAQRLSDISREGLHAVGPNVLLDNFLAVMRSKRPCRRGSGIGYHVERNRRHFYLYISYF